MNNKIYRYIKKLVITFLSVLLFISYSYSQETKWIAIGSLHNWYANYGTEIEVGREGTRQQDGLRWPAFFPEQDNQAAKGLWIACKDYTDNKGVNWPFKVVHCGPRGWGKQESEFVPISFKMFAKSSPTMVVTDGNLRSMTMDQVDDIDPNLLADRMIENKVATAIGITMTRKIYAFANPNDDNYHVFDYVFKNTGDINGDGKSELPNQTLKDVYFYFTWRYSTGREGAVMSEVPNSTQWALNGLFDFRGDGLKPNGKDEDIRCIYETQGLHSQASFDNIGLPNQKNDGHLAGAQYAGNVTLYADKSPSEKIDDPAQPRTTSYEDSDHPTTKGNSQYNSTQMAVEYDWASRGHKSPRHFDLCGDKPVDGFSPSLGGFQGECGYGPYTLKPNEEIHIIIAEGVSGINRELCYSVGLDWLAKRCKPPAGTDLNQIQGATDNDKAKNAWVFTGRDSIVKTFRRAIANYKSNFTLSKGIPAPKLFEVTSGGDRIALTWANNAESDPAFSGYKIYRSAGLWDKNVTKTSWQDYKYELLYECGKGTKNPLVNKYEDKTPVRGFTYYYYILAFSDGSTSNGIPLYSNRQSTQTYDPAALRRPPESSLAKVKIVPNPFNIKAQTLQYVGESDKIMFLNLPPECKIKIYTEIGELIHEINHTDGSGDASWNSITKYNQVVVSGLYIAYFETPSGESTYKKFVIIR